MLKNEIQIKEKSEFMQIISPLVYDPTVQKMKNFRQHYNTSCFKHCLEVSYISYSVCKKLGLDYRSAARAGLLHDLFLYDWRDSKKKLNLEKYHAFIHPKIALNNSLKIFDLNDIEKDIILKHMWPVTFFSIPKYKESFLITLIDKYSALKSSKDYYSKKLHKKTLTKYAYIFLALLIINI